MECNAFWFKTCTLKVSKDLTKFILIYIDDVVVFSKSIDQHFKHFNIFLNVIQRNGLTI